MDDLDTDELCTLDSTDCAEWISVYPNTGLSNLDISKLFKRLDDKYDNGDGPLAGNYRYNAYDTGLIMKKGLPRLYNDSSNVIACYGSSVPNSSTEPCSAPWQVGEWGACNGSGTKYRTVTCPANHTCTGSQPSTSESCYASWQTCSWSACSGGSRTRSVTCPSGYVCNDTKPSTSETCTASWQTVSWSSCSGGTMYRSVTCPSGYTCTGTKPSSSSSCSMGTASWYVSSWSACSGGSKSRTVSCPANYTCSGTKPASTASCTASWSTGSWYFVRCVDGFHPDYGFFTRRYLYNRSVSCPSGYTCSGSKPAYSKVEGSNCKG